MLLFNKKEAKELFFSQVRTPGFSGIRDLNLNKPRTRLLVSGWYFVQQPCYFAVHEKDLHFELRRNNGTTVLAKHGRITFNPGDVIRINAVPTSLRNQAQGYNRFLHGERFITAVVELLGAKPNPNPKKLLYLDNVAIAEFVVVEHVQQGVLVPVVWSKQKKRFEKV